MRILLRRRQTPQPVQAYKCHRLSRRGQSLHHHPESVLLPLEVCQIEMAIQVRTAPEVRVPLRQPLKPPAQAHMHFLPLCHRQLLQTYPYPILQLPLNPHLDPILLRPLGS